MRLSTSASDVGEEQTVDPMYLNSFVKLTKPGSSPLGPDTANGVVSPSS